MQNNLPSTLLLFVLAWVLFMAAPSQASVTYDVVATYDDGFRYEFSFIVSGGDATFDGSTEDKFFQGDDQWAAGPQNTDPFTLTFNQDDPQDLVFDFDIDFTAAVGNLLDEAVRVSNIAATILRYDIDIEEALIDEWTSALKQGGLVVTARPTAAVPEPATLSLIALGVAGLVFLRRRAKLQLEHEIPHGTNAANA